MRKNKLIIMTDGSPILKFSYDYNTDTEEITNINIYYKHHNDVEVELSEKEIAILADEYETGMYTGNPTDAWALMQYLAAYYNNLDWSK